VGLRAVSDRVKKNHTLEFGHPRCACNNEVKYHEGQNTTKFIGYVMAVGLINNMFRPTVRPSSGLQC
jgi:hypothetical protein